MTFGEKLLALRQRSAMSQDMLAEKLNVSRQAVSKWERDEAMPETDNIIRIAQIFQVSTDYLLMADQQTTPPPQKQNTPPQNTATHANQRIEQFIRRHGYKAGYFIIAGGVFVCIIALLVWILLPQFGPKSTQTGNDLPGYGGVIIEGTDFNQNILEEIMQDVYGPGWNGGYTDPFDQTLGQMETSWHHSVRIMATLFSLPLMLIGIAAIVLGSVIVIKGKQIAKRAV